MFHNEQLAHSTSQLGKTTIKNGFQTRKSGCILVEMLGFFLKLFIGFSYWHFSWIQSQNQQLKSNINEMLKTVAKQNGWQYE